MYHGKRRKLALLILFLMGCASGKLGTGVELAKRKVELSLGTALVVAVVGQRMGCMYVNLWPLLLLLVVAVAVDTSLIVLVGMCLVELDEVVVVDSSLVVLMEVCLVELVEVVVELELVGWFEVLMWDCGVAFVGCFGSEVEMVVRLDLVGGLGMLMWDS